MKNLSNVVVTIRLRPKDPADRERGDTVSGVGLPTQQANSHRLALLIEDYLTNGLLSEDLFEYQDGWASSLSGDDEADLESNSFEWEVVDWDVQEAGHDRRNHPPL